MNPITRALACVVFIASSSVAVAQPATKGALPTTPPVIQTLMRDAQGVGDKLVALAKAIPADKYDWRPAPGVRSIREVMLHVASDNYFIPAVAGNAVPAATGINAKDADAVTKFEMRTLSRDSVVAELARSFAFLNGVMAKSTAATITEPTEFFGRKVPMQDVWILTTTHVHEHLGQAIAYARSNGVTPPWSK